LRASPAFPNFAEEKSDRASTDVLRRLAIKDAVDQCGTALEEDRTIEDF